MDNMKDALGEALQRKRAKGLDIQLIIGGHEPIHVEAIPAGEQDAPEVEGLAPKDVNDGEAKKLDLAPKGAEPKKIDEGHPDEQEDMKMVSEAIGAGGKNSLAAKASSFWKNKFKKT